MAYHTGLLSTLLVILIWTSSSHGHGPSKIEDLTVLSVQRTIDIASQLVQMSHKMKVENTNAPPVKSFLFTIEPGMKDHVSFVGATMNKDGRPVTLTTTPTLLHAQSTGLAYVVELPQELVKGKSVDVDVEMVLTRYLVPFPESIRQQDKQLVKFVGNHYLYSPYRVVKQTTDVVLSSNHVESFTKLKPSSHSDTTVTFGPYENIGPWSISECVVHSENNSPFLVVTKLERTIEVSHWGNIAVEEKIEIVHTGAKLKGSFSRFDYQREHNSGISSIKAFKTILPASARDVYYRDDIGNISTSNMWVKHDWVELTLRPRFPLFGGWKTRYVVGYNVPSYEYLYNKGSDYRLKMRVVDHVFDTMVVDDLTVKIILPEGSNDIKVKTPFTMKELPRSLHLTYLDISGRPVITMTGRNFVENHIQDLSLDYTFPKLYMLREPMLVIGAFILLFLTVIICVRLDFSISHSAGTKGSGGKGNNALSGANASAVESVLRRHGKRASVYENFDAAMSKCKTTKDPASFHSSLKALTQEHKSETQGINEVMTSLRTTSPELAETITELQRYDRGLWEVYVLYSQAVEKIATGKISKQQFLQDDAIFNKKRDELAEKVNQVMKSL